MYNLFLNRSNGVLKEDQQNQTNFRSMNVATIPFRPNSSVKLTDPKKDQIMTPLFCRLFFVSNGVELRQFGSSNWLTQELEVTFKSQNRSSRKFQLKSKRKGFVCGISGLSKVTYVYPFYDQKTTMGKKGFAITMTMTVRVGPRFTERSRSKYKLM